MRAFLTTVIAIAVLTVSCEDAREGAPGSEQKAAEANEVNTDSIASEIRRRSEAHAKAAVAKDTAGVGTIFAEDVRYLPNDGDASTGGLRDIWREVKKVKGVTIAYTPTDITVAKAGDLAVERGAIKVTQDGKLAQVGHYIYVWQPRADDWKVTDYMWATRQPGQSGPS
jgi:ketosteroid isomerase-like protein